MRKIILKNCDVNEFASLIEKSSNLENLVFIDICGSEFKSTTYNNTRSALKAVTANLEEYCDGYVNECGEEVVKIQFITTNKIISTLKIIGNENVDITFYIEDNGYANKIQIGNTMCHVNVSAAAKEAVSFLEIPERARYSIFEDYSTMQYKIGITDTEYKFIYKLININAESCRVCFAVNGTNFTVSEIESTDENVRDKVNEIISSGDVEKFMEMESLYTKKVTYDTFENPGEEGYVSCFNKQFFKWIDCEKHYDIELHTNKIKFVSVDDKGTKTYVVFNPLPFA